MYTKIFKAVGPHSNPRNLLTIGYCVESPRRVLKYAIQKRFQIGGYRQIGEIQQFGEGIVIRGTDMEPLSCGLSVIGTLNQIPFSRYLIPRDSLGEADLKWIFGNRAGNIQVLRDRKYKNIFRIEQELIQPEDRVIMAVAKEFVETVKGHRVSLEYLASLAE